MGIRRSYGREMQKGACVTHTQHGSSFSLCWVWADAFRGPRVSRGHITGLWVFVDSTAMKPSDKGVTSQNTRQLVRECYAKAKRQLGFQYIKLKERSSNKKKKKSWEREGERFLRSVSEMWSVCLQAEGKVEWTFYYSRKVKTWQPNWIMNNGRVRTQAHNQTDI